MICRMSAGEVFAMVTSWSRHRSIHASTCDKDFEPTQQIAVTRASVEERRGVAMPDCVAASSIDWMIGANSSLEALRRISWASSLP